MKTLQMGNIWFNLFYDENGQLYSVEDHDHYAGGAISKGNGLTWEDTFIKSLRDRCGGEEFKNQMESVGRELLLAEDGTQYIHKFKN